MLYSRAVLPLLPSEGSGVDDAGEERGAREREELEGAAVDGSFHAA